MVAPAVEGIDLFKIADRSISGWIPSFKAGTVSHVRQPFCSQLEERLMLWLEYHPQVARQPNARFSGWFPLTSSVLRRVVSRLWSVPTVGEHGRFLRAAEFCASSLTTNAKRTRPRPDNDGPEEKGKQTGMLSAGNDDGPHPESCGKKRGLTRFFHKKRKGPCSALFSPSCPWCRLSLEPGRHFHGSRWKLSHWFVPICLRS